MGGVTDAVTEADGTMALFGMGGVGGGVLPHEFQQLVALWWSLGQG